MNGNYEWKEENCLYICISIMGKIYLKNIQVYAFHGCMKEEEKIGSDYLVNLVVDTGLSLSSVTDNLEDTVDYVSLNGIVKEEMGVRSKLLESVANRILIRVLKEHQSVDVVEIKVAKRNPPIGGNVEEVAVKIKLKRRG
jgi:dihydroneopterin aldolase